MEIDVEGEPGRLAALQRYRLLDTPPDPHFDRLVRLTAAILGMPTAMLTLVDEHRQWFKARVGLTVPETARAIAFCDYTIQSAETFVVPDAHSDPRFASNPLVTSDPNVRFYAGAALRSPDGYAIGTLGVIDTSPRRVTEQELRILRQLADFVMEELELWRRMVVAADAHAETLLNIKDRYRGERALYERRFRALVENAPDIILVLDAAGRVQYASPSVERVLGYDPGSLIDKEAWMLWQEPDRAPARELLLQTLPASSTRGVRGEWRLLTRERSVRIVAAVAQNLLDDPAVEGIVVNARDVTAEVASREQLARSQEHLREAQRMEAIGRLAGGIAHDFNNLLTVMVGNTSLILGANEPSPHRFEVLQIQEAAERAASLVRQILAFSRQQVLAPTETNLNELVTTVEGLLKRLIGEHIDIVFQPTHALWAVRVDRAQMEQVLMNLVANARDAMPSGGRIDIRTDNVTFDEQSLRGHPSARPGRFVRLSVGDTGAGIRPEHLEHVFEPFFTTKRPGEGTGLGLATVYGVVKQHDGFVEVDSRAGRGTELRLFLPAVAATRSPPRWLPPELCGSETILVAEDNDLVRQIAVRILQTAGYRVVEARDGEEAVTLHAARPGDIALVMLDIVMPRLGGMAALERIRRERPDVPHLLCSGYATETLDIPWDDPHFVRKPYKPEELLARVRQLIEGRVPAAT